MFLACYCFQMRVLQLITMSVMLTVHCQQLLTAATPQHHRPAQHVSRHSTVCRHLSHMWRCHTVEGRPCDVVESRPCLPGRHRGHSAVTIAGRLLQLSPSFDFTCCHMPKTSKISSVRYIVVVYRSGGCCSSCCICCCVSQIYTDLGILCSHPHSQN